MRIATTAPYQGWSDFRWRNPKTGSIDDKSAWIERMGEYLIGVGIYKSEQPNQNTVSIISGSPGSDATYLQVAYDLAAVLNDGENLRVLPVVGIGGPQNIRDVRVLKGIDIGLTQTSILNDFRRSNGILGVPDDNKIAVVCKLFNLEAHLVVRSGITSIEQLSGQKVNLDEVGSGTNHSMRDVFQRLDIKIEEVNMVQSQALLKVKNGEIAATVLVSGKPACGADPRRLPGHDSARSIDQHRCRRRRAHRVQLAQKHRSLSSRRDLRQRLLFEDRRVSKSGASSEVGRGEPQ